MRRLTIRLAALTAAGSLALAGCNGSSEEPPAPTTTTDTDAATTSAPDASDTSDGSTDTGAADVELEVPYPVPADAARVLPEGGQTLTSDDGHEFTLVGVHRLADDRVVVTGLLGLDPSVGSDFVIDAFEEPALRRSGPGGSEFAPFELTVAGDDATYLPVRDEDERCHCSVIRSGFQDHSEALAVMTVMSAPADAQTVDLTVAGFGEITGAEVTPVPEATTTPWGAKETLTVRTAERQGGTVTARVTTASPDDQTGWGYGVYGFTDDQLCLSGITVAGTGRQAGLVEDCVRGAMPGAGQAEDLEISMPDPGTDSLVVLPNNGFPMTVPITGDAAEGSGEQLVTYEARSRTEGATVAEGEQVEVVLDTSVLFEFDESTLTPEAEKTLAVAVETLQEQDGRSLSIAGHTDTQGEADYNLQLSRERAQAVADALREALGGGWSFDVTGHGEEQPLAEETGSAEEVEAAQARNRRVEITINQ